MPLNYRQQKRERKGAPEVRAVVISEQGETWKAFVALFALVFPLPRVLSQAGFRLCMLVVGGILWLISRKKSSRMPSRVIRLFFYNRLLLDQDRLDRLLGSWSWRWLTCFPHFSAFR